MIIAITKELFYTLYLPFFYQHQLIINNYNYSKIHYVYYKYDGSMCAACCYASSLETAVLICSISFQLKNSAPHSVF